MHRPSVIIDQPVLDYVCPENHPVTQGLLPWANGFNKSRVNLRLGDSNLEIIHFNHPDRVVALPHKSASSTRAALASIIGVRGLVEMRVISQELWQVLAC